MIGGLNMKKIFFVSIILMYLFVITGMMPNKDAADIPLEFNKTEQEPANIFPQKLLDSEYKPSPALHEYAMEANRRINDFFQYLVTGNTTDQSKSYIGHWVLENNNSEKKGSGESSEGHEWGAGYACDILLQKNQLFYSCAGADSYLYFSESGNVYIKLQWYYGIIKQIKIINNYMYLYVLWGDKWILDPVHENGAYRYVKYDSVNITIP